MRLDYTTNVNRVGMAGRYPGYASCLSGNYDSHICASIPLSGFHKKMPPQHLLTGTATSACLLSTLHSHKLCRLLAPAIALRSIRLLHPLVRRPTSRWLFPAKVNPKPSVAFELHLQAAISIIRLEMPWLLYYNLSNHMLQHCLQA